MPYSGSSGTLPASRGDPIWAALRRHRFDCPESLHIRPVPNPTSIAEADVEKLVPYLSGIYRVKADVRVLSSGDAWDRECVLSHITPPQGSRVF